MGPTLLRIVAQAMYSLSIIARFSMSPSEGRLHQHV